MIEIVEVDQWTWTGLTGIIDSDDQNKRIKFDLLTLNDASGGDSEAVKRLGISRLVRRMVDESAGPSIGRVWIKADSEGYAETYKRNFDSSG